MTGCPSKGRKKPVKKSDNIWRIRYQQAHEEHFKEHYPLAYKEGHYFKPDMPKINTANGLTKYICNFINWSGYFATRINVQGRLVDGVEKTDSGALIGKKKWIKSSTAKGTADISATIKGKSVQLEIKVGSDKPRPAQIEMQQKIRKAGGIYEFISTPDEFILLFDNIVNSTLF